VADALVIGLGNDLRGDDAAGLHAVRRLAERGVEVREEQGEAIRLLDTWEGRDAVVLVDTMRSGAPPGTLRRLDASAQPLPAQLRGSSSTHMVALAEAIELARTLGRLPRRVVVHAVEGAQFAAGAGLSAPVAEAVPALADAVLAEVRA
jgi:hydrogenase maturation protease